MSPSLFSVYGGVDLLGEGLHEDEAVKGTVSDMLHRLSNIARGLLAFAMIGVYDYVFFAFLGALPRRALSSRPAVRTAEVYASSCESTRSLGPEIPMAASTPPSKL
jgi:hypothetical protein